MTVSRVLRNRADVSVATRERVLQAARDLGYVPNKIAGSLASSRVNLVAVIIPSLSNMVFPEVMAGIAEALEGTELQPVVGITGYRPEREEKVVYEMLSWRPSGVIIAGIEHNEACRKMLRSSDVPVVEIMDVDGDPIDSVVGVSQRRAGRMMAQAIIEQGFERVGFVGTHLSLDHRARKRFEGFTEALGRAGIEVAEQEFYSGGSSLRKGRELTEVLLGRDPDLDFIYYSSDLIGAGGLMWCFENGYDIPGRIGLAGFNGLELLDGLPRDLATMDSERRAIGLEAARIVSERAAGTLAEPRRVEIEPTIRYGDTLRRYKP